MSDRGGVGISLELFDRWWHDSQVNRLSVFLKPGVSLETVRSEILQRLGGKYRLKVLSLQELLKYHASMIDKAFAFVKAIQILVVVVTIAGIFDLFLSAIAERRRELALWRVIGADKHVLEVAVLIESVTIGVLGAFLGLVIGFITSWIWVRVNFRYLVGYYLDFHFATGTTMWITTLAVCMAGATGYAAARRATSESVLGGIQTE